MKLFKHALLVSILSVGIAMLSLPAQAQMPTPKPPQWQTIVVHLSSYTNDLHAAMMAMMFAEKLQQAGAKVILFLDMEGVRAGDKRQPQDLVWGMPSHNFAEMYRGFVNAGGKVVLCPMCAKAAGITGKDLREGAVIGTADGITNLLLMADKVIDY